MKTGTALWLASALCLAGLTSGRAAAPTIESFGPTGGNVPPTAAIQVQIKDADFQPQLASIQLFTNGVAAAATVTRTAPATRVTLDPGPLWAFGATITVKITFNDMAAPSNVVSKEWQFSTMAAVPVLPVAAAKPIDSGQSKGFTLRLVQAPVNAGLENSTARTETQLSGGYVTERQVFDAPQILNYNIDAPGQAGAFGSDSQFPGVDRAANPNNLAIEAVAYLALKRGLYQFIVNSDDGFRVSSLLAPGDANPLVLGEFNGGRGASDTSFSFVAPTNGLYLFRLTWEQGGGGANLEWSYVDAATQTRALVNDPNAPGAVLAYRFVSGAVSPVVITKQPQDATTAAAATASFSVEAAVGTVTNLFGLQYQWQFNGVDIPGAAGTNYTTPWRRFSDSGGKYRCLVTLPGYPPVASAAATLTVTPESTPPRLVSGATLRASPVIGLSFDEQIDPLTLTNPASYTLSNGALVNQAVPRPDGKSVALTVSAFSVTNFTVTVQNVRDWSGNPLAANSSIPVVVATLEGQDVGVRGRDVGDYGSAFSSNPGDADVVASGSDIWNSTDGFYFLYEVREGDFDVKVQVARLDKTHHYAKAGLMARETLAAGSRNLIAAVSPPDGWNTYYAAYRTQPDAGTGEWPVSAESPNIQAPNSWIRLKRAGDLFFAFRGTNGVDWTQYAQTTLSVSNRLYVGLATSALNNTPGQTTTASFRHYSGTPDPLPPVAADLLIRKGTGEPPTWVLENIYQPKPSGEQVQTKSTALGIPASFQIQAQNDNATARSLTLMAGETNQAGWKVVYKDGANDITSLIHSPAGFATTNLAPGGSQTISVEMTPGHVVPPNTNVSATVSVYLGPLAVNPRDSVQAVAASLPTYQPDLLVRREVDASFDGNDILNNTGAGQTKRLQVDLGSTARYYVQLLNHGNLPDRYVLKSGAGGNGWAVKYTATRSVVRFDGVGAYVDAGGWGPGTRWTAEAWVKASATPGGRRSIVGGFGACRDWGLTMQDGQWGVAIRPPDGCSATLRTGVAVTPDTWNHLAAACDGTNVTLYVNGVQTNSAPVALNYTAYENVRIGSEVCCGGNSFPGLVQEARVWDHALTAEEIRSRMDQVLSGTEAGLLGYWRLNDGGGTTARDLSTYNRPGTLGNGARWDADPEDITAEITGAGWLSDKFLPNDATSFVVEVTPNNTVANQAALELLLTATSEAQTAKVDAVKMVTYASGPSTTPVSALYTSDADFEKGRLVGVENVTVPNQLQLAKEAAPLPFIWVPNSNEGTVSKIDTRTGRELGRYRTCPAGVNGQPSRTTVDQFGNCWVANRQSGTVVKIGLFENGQYLDRNYDGIIQTSQDRNGDGDITGDELLPWGQDECVLYEVIVIPGKEGTYTPGAYTQGYVNDYWNPGPRGIAVDARGNVWAGTHDSKKYYYLDGATAQILRTIDLAPADHTAYGAVIDAQGILWSSGNHRNHVLRLDPKDNTFAVIPVGHWVYGIGVDRANHLFVTGIDDNKISRINVLTGVKEWTIDGPGRGVAFTADGDLWTPDSRGGKLTRRSVDGVLKATIPVGPDPTGVSVDAQGKVWVVNNGDEYVKRIDPATDTVDLSKRVIGTVHYGYSDMTGIISLNATTRIGFWTIVHDGKVPNCVWDTVTWNALDSTGTNITVRVRSSNDREHWSSWEKAVNAAKLAATPPGEYLGIEVTLQMGLGQTPPVLYDLSISALAPGPADLAVLLNAQPSPVLAEYPLVYSTTVTNLSAGWASGVEVTNELAPNLEFVSVVVPGGSYQRTNSTVTLHWAGVAGKSSVTATMTVIPLAAATLTNRATVSAIGSDPNLANNQALLLTEAQRPPCAVPPMGMIGWWPGDGHPKDLINTNHGVLKNGAAYVAAKAGQGFQFSGGDDYVEIAPSPILHSDREVTISGWLRTDGFVRTWQNVFWKGDGTDCVGGCDNREFAMYLNADGHLHFVSTPLSRIGAGQLELNTPSVVQVGRWYHFAAVISGDRKYMRVYVNGQLQAERDYDPSGIRSTAGPLRLGKSPQSDYCFHGALDEIALWNLALTQDQIQAQYAARASGLCKDALFLNTPLTMGGGAVGRPYQQAVTAALGVPPYRFTLATGALPAGLQLSADGILSGVPTKAGTYPFTLRVDDASGLAAQKAFTLQVDTCVAPAAGQLGWWPADGNGDDLLSTNHATLGRAVYFVPGKAGKAFRFVDSSDSYAVLPNSPALMPTNGQLTIEAWIKPDFTVLGDKLDTIMAKRDGCGGNYSYMFGVGKGHRGWVSNLWFSMSGTAAAQGIISTNLVPNDGQFHHVAVTWDGSKAKDSLHFYIDGQVAGTADVPGAIPITTAPAVFGRHADCGYYSSSTMDEISFYNRELSAADILAIYGASGAGKCWANPADFLIKTDGETEAGFALNNIYQTVPAGGQIKSQGVPALVPAIYQVRVENDGNAARTFVVRARESDEPGWRVIYKSGADEINSFVHGLTGFATALLPPGGSQTISVEMTPGLAAPGGATKSATITVFLDSGAASVRDAVMALTSALPSHQPDLMVRRDIDVNYDGEEIYNNTGAGQTKRLEVEPGSTATYLVRLLNAGNVMNTYTLKGTSGRNGWQVRYLGARRALLFDGGGNFVDLGPWTAGNQWTTEAWVKPTSTPGGRRTILGGFAECRDWGITMQDGQFGIAIRQPGGCTLTLRSGEAVVPNTWYHVAGTCDGTNGVLYINGVPKGTNAVEANYVGTAAGMRIGSEVCCGGNSFPGVIDDARLWGRALTAQEVQAEMARSPAPDAAGLLGWWPFDEGQGPTAFDWSTNAHNGTLSGPAWQASLDSVAGAADISADVIGIGATNIVLAPGSVADFIVEVTPDTSIPGGAVLDVLVTASSAADATRLDTVKLVTTTSTPSSRPESGFFTLGADFEKGVFAGVEDQSVADQLQLSKEAVTLPFIWVPNSNEGTVSKVDTRTGKELGRYRTCPPGVNAQPSRTTVDQYGNCWVANRQSGTAVKIGLYENGQYIDRNADGLIQTSHDVNGDGDITGAEVLPWGQDECVLYEVILIPGKEGTYVPGSYTNGYVDNYWNPGPRGVAVDSRANVWIGTHDTRKYYYVDGTSGRILRTNDLAKVDHTPYGAVIDSRGILWSSGYKDSGQQNVLRMDPKDDSLSVIVFNFHTYGLGLDRHNHLFVSGHQESKLARIDVLTGTVDWIVDGFYRSRGVAVTEDGDVWVANSQAGTVARYSNDGLLKGTIAVGPEPTGVSVDAAGKVWVVNDGDEFIHRIDPATGVIDLAKRIVGGIHYGYSDMTGIISRSATTRFGTWTVIHNAKVTNTAWGVVSWTSSEPPGGTVSVRVRSSNDQRGWSDWEMATNQVELLKTPPGKYLEIEVALQSSAEGVSPLLYDLRAEPVFKDSPMLNVKDLGQQNVEISWAASFTGYALEFADALTATAQWRPAVEQPVLANGRNVVTVRATAASRFYRLRK